MQQADQTRTSPCGEKKLGLVCLSRRRNISIAERSSWLFVIPSNMATMTEEQDVFNETVQRSVWVRHYGRLVVLDVQFLDGTRAQRQKVRRVVETKMNGQRFMNVHFNFIDEEEEDKVAGEGGSSGGGGMIAGQVRVAFRPQEHSWSFIGTEALAVPAGEPTMNLSDLSTGNVLHQFAHALGFPHENRHDPALVWRRLCVNSVFAGPPHFWRTPDEMQTEFYDLVNFNQFYNFHSYRPDSLMCAIWPCEFFLQRTPEYTPCNPEPLPTDFTEADKKFFGLYYPVESKEPELLFGMTDTAPVHTNPPLLTVLPSCEATAHKKTQTVIFITLAVVSFFVVLAVAISVAVKSNKALR